MFDFLKRVRAMRKLVRAGRGDELDRVFAAMDSDARFIGAGGALALELAKRRGFVDHYMTNGGRRRHIHSDLLGEIFAKKISTYLSDTRNDPIQEEDLPQ